MTRFLRHLCCVVALNGCAPADRPLSIEGSAPASASGVAASPESTDRVVPISSASAATSATGAARCKGSQATRARFDVDKAGTLARAAPEDVGLDGRVIDELIDGAERAQSDTLIVIRDNAVVIDRRWSKDKTPIETRSVTKGIAALAILALVAEGAIESLDVKLSTFFPEFATPPKSAITLRHVLSHTSGLSHAKTDAKALNSQADRTAYARALRATDPPGKVFSYSNEATQLLSAIIEQRAKEPADRYVKRTIFDNLGITDFTWKKDRAGNVQTYYGLSLHADDFAKLGRLILDEGVFEGRRILPAHLMTQLFMPSERYGGYGLCFWLDPAVTQRAELRSKLHIVGFDVATLAALDERRFASSEHYFEAVKSLLEPTTYARLRTLHRERRGPLETSPGPARALISLGGLGQRLEVHPQERLIAVRQHRRQPGDDSREDLVTFRAMQELLFRLPARCQ